MQSSFSVRQRGEKLNGTERRKIQNRLAQRRFRDKLKENRQIGNNGAQVDDGKEGKKDSQSDPGLYSADSSSSPSQSGFLTPWTHPEMSPHMFPGRPPTTRDRMPNNKQGMREQMPYIYPFNPYPSNMDFYRQGEQYNEMGGVPFSFPNIDPLLTDKMPPANNFDANLPPKQKDQVSDRKKKKRSVSVPQNNTPAQKFTATDSSDLEEAALTTLDKQRVELCNQAEQLVRKTISLYEIGLSLGIVPSNPRLQCNLESASQNLRLLQQNENVDSEEEIEEDDSSENRDF